MDYCEVCGAKLVGRFKSAARCSKHQIGVNTRLDRVIAEADKRGLSYGKYKVLLKQEMEAGNVK